MGFTSILGYTQDIIKARLQAGDGAIDGTMGNGVDTLFLAQCVGPTGVVHAFDVQARAIENTRSRLVNALDSINHVILHLLSHAEMERVIPETLQGSFSAIMFNFGYLPGADPNIITQTNSSIDALEAALRLLKKTGIITAVLYPGHEGGLEEANTIEAWAAALDQTKWKVLSYRFINIKTHPPYLLAIEKKK
jgi:hypothetical protein